MTPKIVTPPDEEPITLEQARAHLESPSYGDSDVDPVDDAMIEVWIGAAREHCENYCGLSFSERTLEVALDEFPACYGWNRDLHERRRLGVELPIGPVRGVESVSWGDESDEEMANDTFVLDTYSPTARVYPVNNWPTVTRGTNRVKIRYLAGYGGETDGSPLPMSLRAAMLLMIGHLYANREATTDAGLVEMPFGVKALLDPYRVRLGMA